MAVASAIVSIITVFVAAAYASAPMIKKSAPGYYRMMLGQFEITVLSDGTRDQPMDVLLTAIKRNRLTRS